MAEPVVAVMAVVAAATVEAWRNWRREREPKVEGVMGEARWRGAVGDGV